MAKQSAAIRQAIHATSNNHGSNRQTAMSEAALRIPTTG
ncbi:hypothetical protein SAMN05216264_10833 [Pseudomonas marincola]|nr:hypothetical protein SAMN05216264_10833 [Pseudomonas marincola]